MGPRVGLDGCEKCRPHRVSIPGPSNPQLVAILTTLSLSIYMYVYTVCVVYMYPYIPVYASNFMTILYAKDSKCSICNIFSFG